MNDRSRYLYPKTANGTRYLYFRYRGKLTPLPVDTATQKFRDAYDAAFKAAKSGQLTIRQPPVLQTPDRGTLSEAIETYINSSAFDSLAASTKRQYLHTLKRLRARIGTIRLAKLDTDAIDIYTDKLAIECGASVADHHLHVLSKIWKSCRKFARFKLRGKFNPTVGAERHYKVQQKHRPWPRNVQDAFMSGAPEHLKLAKLLLHFSAQRGSDCVKMRWTDYDGKGLEVRPSKTHVEVAPLPNYHLCPKPLREALDKAPRVAETILVNARGRPYANANVLSHAIKKELIRLGLAKKGDRSIVMHGLRKTAASDVGSLAVGFKKIVARSHSQKMPFSRLSKCPEVTPILFSSSARNFLML